MKAFIALVLIFVQGQSDISKQVAYFKRSFTALKLDQHLSPSRGNGLQAVLDNIEQTTEQLSRNT